MGCRRCGICVERNRIRQAMRKTKSTPRLTAKRRRAMTVEEYIVEVDVLLDCSVVDADDNDFGAEN